MSRPTLKGTRARRAAIAGLAALALVTVPAGCGYRKAVSVSRPWFIDRAHEYGLDVVTRSGSPEKRSVIESLGSGVALFDVDGDGDLDLFVAPGSQVRDGVACCAGGPWLFRNDGPGRWVDITPRSGLRWTGWAQGVAVADYDADGDVDLFVAQHGPDTLWRNQGDGTFRDVTGPAGLAEPEPRWGASATWGDYDEDGWPDLYVTNYLVLDPANPPPLERSIPGAELFLGPGGLPGQPDVLWRNCGDGTFEDATRASDLYSPEGKGMSALFTDLDGDGRTDLFVTNDTQRNELYHGRVGGHFFEEAIFAGVAYDPDGNPRGSMGIDVADIDGDGKLDLAFSNFRGDGTSVYRNRGNRIYQDISHSSGVFAATARFVGWGIVLADFDDDGRPDLFQSNGHVFPASRDYAQSPVFLRNKGHGSFEDATAAWGPDLAALRSGRSVAVGDLDNDGDLDLVMTTMDGPLRVLINEGRRESHSLAIHLKGKPPNREALGAHVELSVEGRTLIGEVRRGGSLLAASDIDLHFGLGSAERVDRMNVRWPDGTRTTHGRLPVDVVLHLDQGDSAPSTMPFLKLNPIGAQATPRRP